MFLNCPITARDVTTQLIYVSCDFWLDRANQQAGEPPILQNDFLMQIAPTVRSILTQGGRWVRLDGVRVDPANVTEADDLIGWQYTTTNKTNAATIDEVEQNILNYWARAKANNYRGDQRSFRSLSQADPDGTLSKILAFRGAHDYPGL